MKVTPISTDIIVLLSVIITIVSVPFVMGRLMFVCLLFIERVFDAFVEDSFSVLWCRGTFCSGNSMKARVQREIPGNSAGGIRRQTRQ